MTDRSDPLVAALARYIAALDRRYPGGPEQMRRERLDAERERRTMREERGARGRKVA